MRQDITTQFLKGLKTRTAPLREDRTTARDFYLDTKGPTGFGVQHTEKGAVTFIMTRRWPGTNFPQRRTIGEFPAMSYADARKIAGEWAAKAANGVDPEVEREKAEAEAAEERRRIAREQSALVPFAQVAEDFIAENLNGKRAARDEAEIRRHVIPFLGDYAVTKINSGHIILLGNEFRKKKATGRLLVGHVKRIFTFALHQFVKDADGEPVNRYGLEVDPAVGVKPKKLFGEKISKDRILTDEELAVVWRLLDQFDEPAAKALKLIAYTGMRREEVGQLAWSEVDLKARTITLEADRFKSGVKFVVPLSDGAVTLLCSIKRGKKGDFAFSARGTDGAKHIDGWGPFFKKLREPLHKELGKPKQDWSAHDVRRTVRTAFSKLEVPDSVAELAIGHVKVGLNKTYNLWEAFPQRREAFEKWEALLNEIVTPPASGMVLTTKKGKRVA